MGDSTKIENMRSCVLKMSPGLGVSRKELDRDGDGKVSDREAADFYFADNDMRALCFEEVGVRHPMSLLGHTDAEKRLGRRVQGDLVRISRIVKSRIARQGLQVPRRHYDHLMKDLKVYHQLTSVVKGEAQYKASLLIMKAGALLERASGRDRAARREGLDPGMLTNESLSVMERDDRIVGHEGSKKLIAQLHKRIEKKITKLSEICADAYNTQLATGLGRYLREHRFGLRHNIGRAEYTGLEALKEGRGSCTEYAYIMYSLCRAAGIPKDKIRPVSEHDVGRMGAQRVGHVSLAIRVSKAFRSGGFYSVDFSRNRYDAMPAKGEVGNRQGLLAIYLGGKSVVLSRKGEHREASRLARMALSLWKSKTTYRYIVSVLQRAARARVKVVSVEELEDIRWKVWEEFSLDSPANKVMRGLVDDAHS